MSKKGRPTNGERVINESFQLSLKKDTKIKLDKLASKKGISVSEIIRNTIVNYLINDIEIPELQDEMQVIGIRVSKEIKTALYEKAGDNSTINIRYLIEQMVKDI